MQYEVIMTDIGHSMERDGRVQVFGDVVFALPDNRRSRISSFGTGADKAEARQALIDRATEYLIEEEQLHDYMTRNHLESEENFSDSYGRYAMPTTARCGVTGLPIQSWMAGSAEGVCPLVVGNATTEQIENWIEWMAANYDDWYPQLRGAIIELNSGNIMLTPEDLEEYNAEKKSSKQTAKDVIPAAPVEVVNNRAGFFDDEQDKEYFGFGFIVGGIIVGVLGTIFGNIFSELVLDEMRVKKFGYRDSSQTESSFWELDSD